MLHQDVLMADIDVDQWRNAQALLLRSAKGARRLVVIHEQGAVVKFMHTHGVTCDGRVDRVGDPKALAQRLYEANHELVDFVVIMERNAVDAYFSAVQNAWDIDDDLDVFVQQTYAKLDDFADGIVTHPGPARDVLGLQWKTGSSLDELNAVAAALVRADTTVVLGVHDDTDLWASLVLDFDAEHKVTSITTADPSLVDIQGSRTDVLDRLTAWQSGAGKTVSLGLAIDRGAVGEFLAAPTSEKAGVLAGLVAAGKATYRA